MKKILGLIALILLLSSCFPSLRSAPPLPAYTGAKKALLVIPIRGNVYADALNTVQANLEQTVTRGAYGQRFLLVDRTSIENVLRELRLSSIGLVDDSTSLTLGRQIGAKLSLSGQVLSLDVSTKQGGDGKYGYYTIYTTQAQISLKLVNLETGAVMSIARGSGSVTASKQRGRSDDGDALGSALREATDQLIQDYVSQGN